MTVLMPPQTKVDMATNHAVAFLIGTTVFCVGLIVGLLFVNVLSALLVAGSIGATGLLIGGCLIACITIERHQTQPCHS